MFSHDSFINFEGSYIKRREDRAPTTRESEDEAVRVNHVAAVSSSSANCSAQKWRVNDVDGGHERAIEGVSLAMHELPGTKWRASYH